VSDSNPVAGPGPTPASPPTAPSILASSEQDQDQSRWSTYAELLVALAVVILGVVILLQTQDIRVTRATARVGPRVFPWIVGGGLIVIGLWYAVELLRGQRARPAADSEDVDITLPPDWTTLAGIGAGLVAYALLIEGAGFIIASAALYVITAFSMGSRKIVRDIGIGIVIAVGAYVAFSEGLGVRLPQGILDGLIG
jgi:putative tricarboxylic transport membrane protein